MRNAFSDITIERVDEILHTILKESLRSKNSKIAAQVDICIALNRNLPFEIEIDHLKT
jgi:hypothetical protein